MLKSLNFILSSFIPQKLYWHIVGLVHPWESVLEGLNRPEEVYKESGPIVRILKKLKLINRSSEVLDIGCGVGRLEYSLAKEVKFCVGIDIASSMIALAKKYIKAENVDFITVNGKDLTELRNRQFDLIFSIIVFQHLPRDIFKSYIIDSFKHLRKGGKLFFQIPIYTGPKPPEPPHKHPWAIRSYRLDELSKILKTAGFDSINFYSVSGNSLNGKENQVFVLGVKK